jgi:hypothetical protein
LARPHVTSSLAEGYRAMAADEAREREAEEWANSTIEDAAEEPR